MVSLVRIQHQLAYEPLKTYKYEVNLQFSRSSPFKLRILLPLKKEAARSSENFMPIYQNIWRHIPDNSDLLKYSD
jgi:hypothetical protein